MALHYPKPPCKKGCSIPQMAQMLPCRRTSVPLCTTLKGAHLVVVEADEPTQSRAIAVQ